MSVSIITMLSRCASLTPAVARRAFSSSPAAHNKVAVLGAAGGIGQPLSMLLRQATNVTDLRLYDLAHTKGVAADLSHIDVNGTVQGFAGDDELGDALNDCDAVVIPAGMPRKPGMTRQDLFDINAGIVAKLADAVATHCPNALVGIISNPVNSTVPVFADVMERHGKLNTNRIFGITTLDVVRANQFMAEVTNKESSEMEITVIGGHAGKTIIPIGLGDEKYALTQEQIEALTVRVQNGGTEVVEAKAGAGSATLSMAYAGARFMLNALLARDGQTNIRECAYVRSDVVKGCDYFSTPLLLGVDGLEENMGMPELTDYEAKLVEACVPELQASIEDGRAFVKKNYN